jgi:hypothetical protein
MNSGSNEPIAEGIWANKVSLTFIALDNGLPSGETSVDLVTGPKSVNVFVLNHISVVGVWRWSSTCVRLHLYDLQFVAHPEFDGQQLLAGHAMLEFDGMPVGRAPWCAWIGLEWPQAPVGVLHFPQMIEVDHGPIAGKHMFSLLTYKYQPVN